MMQSESMKVLEQSDIWRHFHMEFNVLHWAG